MKKPCNKLKIIKNKKSIDLNGHFDYMFEWYNNKKLLFEELKKIQADDHNLPIENYDLKEIIEHKQYCCFEIDTKNIIIEQIEL